MTERVLILGGTSDIAQATAIELAKLGTHLVLAARDMEQCERIARDLRTRHDVTVTCMHFDALDFELPRAQALDERARLVLEQEPWRLGVDRLVALGLRARLEPARSRAVRARLGRADVQRSRTRLRDSRPLRPAPAQQDVFR